MLAYAQIEDAVIAAVKAASDGGALGYRILEAGSYGGQFDDETFFTQFRRFPAVWVTVAGGKPKRLGAKTWEVSPVIAVMVGARNVRGERHTRHGSVGEVGTYQMQQDVRDLLVGSRLDLGIAPLAIGADRTLFNTRIGRDGLSVLAQEFHTTFTYRQPEATVAGDLTGIGLRYYIKPGDDIEDATDEVTLAVP